jgi:hypothetical protein
MTSLLGIRPSVWLGAVALAGLGIASGLRSSEPFATAAPSAAVAEAPRKESTVVGLSVEVRAPEAASEVSVTAATPRSPVRSALEPRSTDPRETTTDAVSARSAGPASATPEDVGESSTVDPGVAQELRLLEFAAVRAAERLGLEPEGDTTSFLGPEARRRAFSDEVAVEFLVRLRALPEMLPDGTSSAGLVGQLRSTARESVSQATPAARLRLLELALAALEG